jgi:hypothetical protein
MQVSLMQFRVTVAMARLTSRTKLLKPGICEAGSSSLVARRFAVICLLLWPSFIVASSPAPALTPISSLRYGGNRPRSQYDVLAERFLGPCSYRLQHRHPRFRRGAWLPTRVSHGDQNVSSLLSLRHDRYSGQLRLSLSIQLRQGLSQAPRKEKNDSRPNFSRAELYHLDPELGWVCDGTAPSYQDLQLQRYTMNTEFCCLLSCLVRRPEIH